jgi:hypothetical protein
MYRPAATALADVIVVFGRFTEAILSHVAARAAGLSGTIPAKIPNRANAELFIGARLIFTYSIGTPPREHAGSDRD